MRVSLWRKVIRVSILTILLVGISTNLPNSIAVSANEKIATQAKASYPSYVAKKELLVRTGKHIKNKVSFKVAKGKTVYLVSSHRSWSKIKYGSKTGYVPSKEISKKSSKKVVSDQMMSRSKAETHLKKDFTKNKDGRYVLYDPVVDDNILIAYFIPKSPRAGLYVDAVFYSSMVTVQPKDFGQENYDEMKKLLKITDAAIKTYAETQFGVNTPTTRLFIREIKQYALGEKIGSKEFFIGGKKFHVNSTGSGPIEFFPL